VRRADRIFVMAAGRLIESGTFDELIAQFARLARRRIL
jgi:ABC-type multidrug transport system fused ATPase/permease subunit